jgi:very-short-patch-repair endonuclease
MEDILNQTLDIKTSIFVIVSFVVFLILILKKNRPQVEKNIANNELNKLIYQRLNLIPIRPDETKQNKEDNYQHNKTELILKEKKNEEIELIKTTQHDKQNYNSSDYSSKGKSNIQSTIELEKKSNLLNEILFVTYEVSELEKFKAAKNHYPILKYPKKGTVIRSYQLGRSNRRGFKEEQIQKFIEGYLGDKFIILGGIRLNTGNKTNPYEPDIAIIYNFKGNNLRIDIEIDEPYASITRQPTHCIEADEHRDRYFTERGWIVIRFSEHQVHLYPEQCLKYIFSIINIIFPEIVVPDNLLVLKDLNIEAQWDEIQAQKWELEKYREKYLNHNFQKIDEKTSIYDRNLSEIEISEEKFVRETSWGNKEKITPVSFNQINSHYRDSKIDFYPESHLYTIDNVPCQSVTKIISNYFPVFDSIQKSKNLSRNNPLYGLNPNEIVKIWNERSELAKNAGKKLHESIENFYLGLSVDKTKEFTFFEKFSEDHKQLVPFRTEWRIYDEEHNIAGTVDLIAKNNSEYEIYDWKRSEKIVDTASGKPIVGNAWGSCGVGELSVLPDCSFIRYCIQQSFYKFILEKNYGINISKMYLVVLHPNYNKYYKIEVVDLRICVDYILGK